jgi:hypothetical protein
MSELAGCALLWMLGACGEEDRTEVIFTRSTEEQATSVDDLSPELMSFGGTTSPGPVPAAAGDAVAIVLVAGSGITLRGEALLKPAGATAAVTVRLSGGEWGATYDGSIRRGNCQTPGARVASLMPVTADSSGNGSSYSGVPVRLEALELAPHIATYGAGGRVETCGEF